MKVTYKQGKKKPKKMVASDIEEGQVFKGRIGGKHLHYKISTHLRIFEGVVDLEDPYLVWTGNLINLEITDYAPLEAELLVHEVQE